MYPIFCNIFSDLHHDILDKNNDEAINGFADALIAKNEYKGGKPSPMLQPCRISRGVLPR
jgi:hypothetical protein